MIALGETPQTEIVRLCQEQTPEGYKICGCSCSEEYQALQRMLEQGIDAHLEAIYFKQDNDDRGFPRFTQWAFSADDSPNLTMRKIGD